MEKMDIFHFVNNCSDDQVSFSNVSSDASVPCMLYPNISEVHYHGDQLQ